MKFIGAGAGVGVGAAFFAAILLAESPSFSRPYIYVASSLSFALEKVLADYTPLPTIIYGSSALLARQIKQQAHADIFITAHPDWLAHVSYQEKTLFLTNRLVFAGSPHSTLQPQALDALVRSLKSAGEKLALSSEHVPVGLYAKQALQHHGLWSAAREIAVFSSSARQTLTWLVQNKVAAAVIYESDQRLYPQLRRLYPFPAATHAPIGYYIARLNDKPATMKLWHHLLARQRAFRAFGFQ